MIQSFGSRINLHQHLHFLVSEGGSDQEGRFHSVHEEYPDLVEKYTAFLEEQWEAHQVLGQYFTPAEGPVLTPEQLEMLRALGYIR